jgi:hypothetical protein
MALEFTELQAVSDDYVEKGSVDIYFSENVLLYLLMGKGMMASNLAGPSAGKTVDGGKKLKQILEMDESNSGSYGNTTKIDMSKKDVFNAALFDWAGYYASNTIDLDDQVQNSGGAALIDLVYGKLQNIQKTIRKTMGAAIFATGTGTPEFAGLGNLFDTTTATEYGNIAEDDMATWKANSSAVASTMNFAFMQSLRRTAKVANNAKGIPNIYITTDTLKDAFTNTLQVQARYSDSKLADAGFKNILFEGVPMVADDNQTASYVDGLNLEFLKILTHEKYQFTNPKWERGGRDQPDSLTADIRWIGQLVCSNRKAHARATVVTA